MASASVWYGETDAREPGGTLVFELRARGVRTWGRAARRIRFLNTLAGRIMRNTYSDLRISRRIVHLPRRPRSPARYEHPAQLGASHAPLVQRGSALATVSDGHNRHFGHVPETFFRPANYVVNDKGRYHSPPFLLPTVVPRLVPRVFHPQAIHSMHRS
jgi:hypothetical protein